MENSEKKKNKDEGIGWLTRPLYNVMLLSLVVLFTLQERATSYDDVFHMLLFFTFAIIIIANVWGFFDLIKRIRKPKEKEEIETEEE